MGGDPALAKFFFAKFSPLQSLPLPLRPLTQTSQYSTLLTMPEVEDVNANPFFVELTEWADERTDRDPDNIANLIAACADQAVRLAFLWQRAGGPDAPTILQKGIVETIDLNRRNARRH